MARSKPFGTSQAACTPAVLALALTLGGCGANDDPAVAVEEAARELSEGLPKAVELASITAVRAEGTRLIIDMTLDSWNPPERIAEFRARAETADRLRLCGEVATMTAIGMGATVVSRYSRPGGPSFETSISSCAAPAPPPPPADPSTALAAEIASAVETMRIGLPRQVDSITTLTGIRSEGTTVYYEMSMNQDLSASELRDMRPGLQADFQRTLCTNPESSRLIRWGATIRHRYTDPSGDQVEIAADSCPGAPAG